jgi:hypothetical protein
VVEQRPFKPKVVGSIPTAPTKPALFFNELQKTWLHFSGLAPKRCVQESPLLAAVRHR